MEHYNRLDELPIYNYFRCLDGEYSYLFKKNTTKKAPEKFKEIFESMYFQFEKLELSVLRKRAKIIEIEADVLSGKKQKHFLNKVTQLQSEIAFSMNNGKSLTLNDMLKTIRYTSKVDFDPKTTSTSLAFSYYHDAIEYLKKKEK